MSVVTTNGYVYEHRLVMSEMLGRVLESWEQVHHIDGNKKNNDPSNLELVTDEVHHFRHRSVYSKLQVPGEKNIIIECECGCGREFRKFDKTGRPRSYVSGHNKNSSNTKGVKNPKKGRWSRGPKN